MGHDPGYGSSWGFDWGNPWAEVVFVVGAILIRPRLSAEMIKSQASIQLRGVEVKPGTIGWSDSKKGIRGKDA